MSTTLKVEEMDCDLAIRVPKVVADQCGIVAGSSITIEARSGQLVIWRKKHDLEDLVSQMTPENQHPEIFDGPPSGREEW